MRYFKKNDEKITEYHGVSLGGEQWYINLGWLPYDTNLPLSRLDIVDGEIVELPAPPAPPAIYSRFKIKQNLAELGLWESLKTGLIEANYYDDFVLAENLSADDEKFITALSLFDSLLADSGTTTAELLANSLWED